MFIERRKYPRIEGRFVVSVKASGANPEETEVTQTQNLSLGGMLITTNKLFDKGATLELEIRLPTSDNSTTLSTKVVESREKVKNYVYETRLEFLNMNEEQKQIISQFYRIKAKK